MSGLTFVKCGPRACNVHFNRVRLPADALSSGALAARTLKLQLKLQLQLQVQLQFLLLLPLPLLLLLLLLLI